MKEEKISALACLERIASSLENIEKAFEDGALSANVGGLVQVDK